MFGLGVTELIIILFVLIAIYSIYSLYVVAKKNNKLNFAGTIQLIIGLIGFIWTNGHSPYMTSLNVEWILKEPFYYIFIIIFISVLISGAINLYKGVKCKADSD